MDREFEACSRWRMRSAQGWASKMRFHSEVIAPVQRDLALEALCRLAGSGWIRSGNSMTTVQRIGKNVFRHS